MRIEDDDDFDHFYSDNDTDCDCSDYDTDLMEGRAWCHRCGRRWDLTAKQVKREIEFQADYMAQFEQDESPAPVGGKDDPFEVAKIVLDIAKDTHQR